MTPSAGPRIPEASFEATVRSYELDSYGHMNNAVYQQWFEEGRESVLRRGGVDYDWFPRETGLWFVVARTEIDFRAAARRGERVVVRSVIADVGRKSVRWLQTMTRADGVLLAEARTIMCFARDGRAEPPPPAFLARFCAAPPQGDAAR